jgi:formylmethanofuran dehydrogenase subunit E
MPRILIFIILAYLFYVIGKRLLHIVEEHQAKNKARAANHKQKNSGERIVKCARCGTHVPENETVLLDGQPVCKQVCRE